MIDVLILVRDLKLNKFRTIRPNSVLWARFLMFLLHQILRHISSSEFTEQLVISDPAHRIGFSMLE
jgi:hypothetical protein